MRSCLRLLSITSLGIVALMPVEARADVLNDINTVRIAICKADKPRAALQLSPALNRAAEGVARGAAPRDALAVAGYAASRASSVSLQGVRDGAQLQEMLARYCSVIADPEFSEIGVSAKKDRVWLVLAVAHSAPADAGPTSARVLKLVNEARSRPRRCGGDSFEAARPLTLNAQLGRAALQHSQEMAKYSLMQHEGRDGSTPAQRVTLAGYRWRAVAENVAAGQRTAEEVVAGWMASPGHCENIMNAHYSEMGIASAVNEKDRYGVYWTLTLAAPR